MKNIQTLYALLLPALASAFVVLTGRLPAQPVAQPAGPPVELPNLQEQNRERAKFDFRQDNEGVQDLRTLYKHINRFRMAHAGMYPSSITSALKFLAGNGDGEKNFGELKQELANIDSRTADSEHVRTNHTTVMPYLLARSRPNKTSLGGVKLLGTRDALATSGLYRHERAARTEDGKFVSVTNGYDLVLWDDGEVDAVPYDQTMFMFLNEAEAVSVYASQAGVNEVSLTTYEEISTGGDGVSFPPIGKPIALEKIIPTPDNGGPESLVTLSRLLAFPSRYGIGREELWKHFDPAQEEFTLADVQAGAAKLNLSLDLRTLTLDELQNLNPPAIFLTSDDKRLVVLSQFDDKDAIVIDRGLTRIVSRDLLARRYGGQVLAASSTSTPANGPQVLADDPVRSLSLTSPDQAVTQTVKITNSGTSPLTLQVERPIPGAEKAELSASTLAPGQSATLSLTLRWRTILKSPTQNVLVFVATNDPRRPRLPLAFKLSLPQANPQDAAPANRATP